jgi:molybdopterin synthase catalytic subunit
VVERRGAAIAVTSGLSRKAARSAVEIPPYNDHVIEDSAFEPAAAGERPVEPPSGADWFALSGQPLPVEVAVAWVTTPGAGAVVTFLGVVRDSSDGRSGVVGLGYEAYEAEAVRVLAEIAAEARRRWPALLRIALLHRTGELGLSEPSVAVVVSSPHRPEAFEAARFCIDTLKESAPIWKREHWTDGSDWAMGEQPIVPVGRAARVGASNENRA